MLPRERGITVEHHLTVGDPVSEIVDLAAEKRCVLIVIGTHGRSGLSRLILGSVAELVLRKASCPVLMVKAPPTPITTEPTAAATTVDVSAAILSSGMADSVGGMSCALVDADFPIDVKIRRRLRLQMNLRRRLPGHGPHPTTYAAGLPQFDKVCLLSTHDP